LRRHSELRFRASVRHADRTESKRRTCVGFID
jgi:hypothetical protein